MDNNNINEMIGSVLSDPEALGNIMKMAEGLMSKSSGGNDADEETSTDEHTDTGKKLNFPLKAGASHKQDDDNRVKLLLALKPYLNDDRREKVEMILQVLNLLRLTDLTGLLSSLHLNK